MSLLERVNKAFRLVGIVLVIVKEDQTHEVVGWFFDRASRHPEGEMR